MPQDTPLHKAANEGCVEDIQEELAQGANVNAKGAQGRTALHRALGVGNLPCVEELLSNNADPGIDDGMKRTALHWAVAGKSMECLSILFEDGNKGKEMINKQSKSEMTALHFAVSQSLCEMASYLIKQGADITLKDEDSKTAFKIAKDMKIHKSIEFPKGAK